MINIKSYTGLLLREIALRLLGFADNLCRSKTVTPLEVTKFVPFEEVK